MKITKLEHSGVMLEKDGKVLIFDPVEILAKIPEVSGVAAIIITHGHFDHLQPEVVERILAGNVGARIFTTEDTADKIRGAEVVKSGDKLEVGGFRLEFFGGEHMPIFDKVPCQNVGVVVDDYFLNPGDSLDFVPGKNIGVLFCPIVAPWCKGSDSVEFIKKYMPKIVMPAHDALLSEFGKGVYVRNTAAMCEEMGVKFEEKQIVE